MIFKSGGAYREPLGSLQERLYNQASPALHGVTGCYRDLQGVTGSYRGAYREAPPAPESSPIKRKLPIYLPSKFKVGFVPP